MGLVCLCAPLGGRSAWHRRSTCSEGEQQETAEKSVRKAADDVRWLEAQLQNTRATLAGGGDETAKTRRSVGVATAALGPPPSTVPPPRVVTEIRAVQATTPAEEVEALEEFSDEDLAHLEPAGPPAWWATRDKGASSHRRCQR